MLIAQAGQYAEHLGRLDLEWDGNVVTIAGCKVLAVGEDEPQAPALLNAVTAVEAEVAHLLGEVVGELAEPLDFATDRECGVGNLMADVLRARMGAEVGVIAVGHAWTGPLPAGPLTRLVLYDVCPSPANPGIVTLSGAQLMSLVVRGLDPALAAERPKQLRGEARGLLHVSGAAFRDGVLLVGEEPIDPTRQYRVAGSDWEFEPYGGYAEPKWELKPRYDVPVILREAVEEYLAQRGSISISRGRLEP